MSSQITCKKLTAVIFTAILIQLIGLSLFIFGFFPIKPALSGISGPESFRALNCDADEVGIHNETALPPDQLRSHYQELSGIPPSFDRLILMVIDGLPAEFVLGRDNNPPDKEFYEAMPYTQSLLAGGMAIGYHAKAAPPTVTMPRLKAMVSGAIGGFLDVAFNFNTQILKDDNLVAQFFRIGWKMVMLGDDTWLKLFPHFFTRHDGVSSFFVKDTVQVDQNVSRHLDDELSRDDWNFLVLHYLGLDHVGHVGGRNSPLMYPKLKEMDEVIHRIHSAAIQDQGKHWISTLLVVVSDHGMTANGNHGGSSYEETDSLVLFVGLQHHVMHHDSDSHKTVHQVDIAPTLALLFGVPIPKNNVGVVIPCSLDSMTEEQKLRALELNSWQLYSLLRAQLSGLECWDFAHEDFIEECNKCNGNADEKFSCLYRNAAVLHRSWKQKKIYMSSSKEDHSRVAAAYHEFLKTSSEWLSRKVTDKPVGLLAFGVAAMVISCLILLHYGFQLHKEIYRGNKQHSKRTINAPALEMDETFILSTTLILVISMGSSSMVEEEQYIWHFLGSTFFLLLLRKTAQFLLANRIQGSLTLYQSNNRRTVYQAFAVLVLLLSGRILSGWHQGGVNWTHLPDISKWLEATGKEYLKTLQLTACLLVICLSLFSLSLMQIERKLVSVVGISFLLPGLLVLKHIMEYQDSTFASSSYGATLLVQKIYTILGALMFGIFVALPWLIPAQTAETCCSFKNCWLASASDDILKKIPVLETRFCLYMIGWACTFSWSFLQLLLQQPVNCVPIFLLLVQVYTIMLHSYNAGPLNKQWLEVALLYHVGMAGHFALGNSNSLATIDVASAFIGISSYSTLFSGILMFIITYASPMLFLLSLPMQIAVKDVSWVIKPEEANSGDLLKKMLAFPCILPLCLNSILLTAYTVVLLLMRNHLFVWSVFSPKYLYVTATTVCIYLGVSIVAASGIYVYMVMGYRRRQIKEISQ